MSTLAIETEKLSKKYGAFTALKGLDLKIKPGIVYGFLGPNGCGKTTTLRMLSGVLTPSGGTIKLFGQSADSYTASLRSSIGYMSQKFSLYNELSCYENLKFYAGMYGLVAQERDKRIDELLQLTQLREFANELAGTLSGGWRQRLALAVAIIHAPKILFLDEPTSGVDPVSGRLFWDIVYTLASSGVTIVVSTHSMDEAEHCDAIGFLSDGELIEEGTPASLKASFPRTILSIKSQHAMDLYKELTQKFGKALESYICGDEIRIQVQKGSEELFDAYNAKRVEPSLEDVFVYLREYKHVATT